MHSPDGVRKWSKTGSYKSTTIEELISKRSREGPEPVQNRPDNRPKPVQNGPERSRGDFFQGSWNESGNILFPIC
jgi:hypothetical protein